MVKWRMTDRPEGPHPATGDEPDKRQIYPVSPHVSHAFWREDLSLGPFAVRVDLRAGIRPWFPNTALASKAGLVVYGVVLQVLRRSLSKDHLARKILKVGIHRQGETEVIREESLRKRGTGTVGYENKMWSPGSGKAGVYRESTPTPTRLVRYVHMCVCFEGGGGGRQDGYHTCVGSLHMLTHIPTHPLASK